MKLNFTLSTGCLPDRCAKDGAWSFGYHTLLCNPRSFSTHPMISLAQTLMHSRLGQQRFGGRVFRDHIGFHHICYARDHLVSRTYLAEEGTTRLISDSGIAGCFGNIFFVAAGALCY